MSEKMTKQKLIDYVIEGHITDIREWVARDTDSLARWLTYKLGLKDMSEDDIRKTYGVYLPDGEWEQ